MVVNREFDLGQDLIPKLISCLHKGYHKVQPYIDKNTIQFKSIMKFIEQVEYFLYTKGVIETQI